MSDVVRPCYWICVPKCSPPEAPIFQVGFGKPCCFHLGVKCKDASNILGPDWGPSLAILGLLRRLEATALLLAAKLGDLEGKLGDREVMLKLSRAMLCQVEATCQVLFSHVVGFAPRNALPKQDQDFKWASASHVGSSTAILWLCWHCWHHFGINFRHLGAHDDAMWAQFGDATPASPKTTPSYTSKTLSPMALKAYQKKFQKQSQSKTSPKTLIPMAGKVQRNQKSAKNASQKS